MYLLYISFEHKNLPQKLLSNWRTEHFFLCDYLLPRRFMLNSNWKSFRQIWHINNSRVYCIQWITTHRNWFGIYRMCMNQITIRTFEIVTLHNMFCSFIIKMNPMKCIYCGNLIHPLNIFCWVYNSNTFYLVDIFSIRGEFFFSYLFVSTKIMRIITISFESYSVFN